MTAVLELRAVSKTYLDGSDQVHALREVDMAVEPGSMVAVMGPSGSGKSTLLTIAGTLETPTSGEVLIAGIRCRRCRVTIGPGCGGGPSVSSSRTSTCCPG